MNRLTVGLAVSAVVAGLMTLTAVSPNPVAASPNCSLSYIITPYLTDGPAVQSSAQVTCGTNVFTLTIQEELYKWTGSSWSRVDFRQDQCTSCSLALVVVHKACSTSTLTSYYARARIQWPDTGWSWSAWTPTSSVSLRCS